MSGVRTHPVNTYKSTSVMVRISVVVGVAEMVPKPRQEEVRSVGVSNGATLVAAMAALAAMPEASVFQGRAAPTFSVVSSAFQSIAASKTVEANYKEKNLVFCQKASRAE